MKATVKKRFHGIKEGIDFEVGTTFEGTKERIDEINEALPGYLEIIPTRSRKTTKQEEKAE